MSLEIVKFSSVDDIFNKITKESFDKIHDLYKSEGEARTPDTIKREAAVFTIKAMNSMKFYVGSGREATKPKSVELKEVDKNRLDIINALKAKLPSALLEFCMSQGSFSSKRWFFKVGVSGNGKTTYYAGHGEIEMEGNGSKHIITMADMISTKLKEGKESAISSFFKSNAFIPAKDQWGYMFTKANYVTGFPKQSLELWQADMALIMQGMMNQPSRKGENKEWNWDDAQKLKFFSKKAEAEKEESKDKVEKSTEDDVPSA